MRVLVTGALGMLGSDLVGELGSRGFEVVATDLPELDITDPVSVGSIASQRFGQIEWVVNCAAYTAVDKAESDVQRATEINAFGPGYLARAAGLAGAKMVHLSTDFVFDGNASTPYREDDPTNPLGVYGDTKLAGEKSALGANPQTIVVRTSWLYGPNGPSFPRTMIQAHEAGKPLRVVADQFGNPTYTADLSRVLVDLIERNAFPGVYHASGPETMSWRDLAGIAIETWSGRPASVEPIATSDWPTPAQRPAYSALSFDKVASLRIEPMRPVREAMADFCRRLRDNLTGSGITGR
ncbi:MAG TPA: dTDP-4-dehydrorhamnose reductase [Fimbriimonas sp.]